MGARRRASKSGSRGEGVGSGERRKGELWNEKKIRESSFLRLDKLAISATRLIRVWWQRGSQSRSRNFLKVLSGNVPHSD